MERLASRIEELCRDFEFYLEEFDRLNPFTGPSVYFHLKTLERLRSLGLSKIFEDECFFEYLYATLASWGMHRMGPGGAKLVEFSDFMETLKGQMSSIIELKDVKLVEISEDELGDVMDKLWKILSSLRVSATETQLIAGSKALHHLLPDLLPPIDRQHTLKFVYGYSPTYGSEKQWFEKAYRCLWKIGTRKKDTIPRWVGKGFHTSETKVVDNAVIAYVKTRMRRSR